MAVPSSNEIKKMAIDFGATIVGIAPVERFEGAPPGHGPLDLVPQAKSVIVAGVRIPDPVVDWDEYHLKMTEMDTELGIRANMENFYMQMGHFVEDMMLNIIATKLANYLEIEHGLRTLPAVNAQHTGLGHPVMEAPMGFFSQRHAAVRAGLGEFGYNGLVINPRFGPRVRYVSAISEADLEPDPLLTEKVCLREQCGGADGPICQQKCTNNALKMRMDVNLDDIFIDLPITFERFSCINMSTMQGRFGCKLVGSCLRDCPVGKQVTKK